MSRILAYTSPTLGHLYPIVPILQEMQRRGHHVALRTLAAQVALMSGLGIDAKPVSESLEQIELDDYRGRSLPAKGTRALMTFAARAEHDAADLRAAIDDEHPDALLVDCMTWGALAVAESSGLPWAQYVPYPSPLPSRDTPPIGLGLSPAHDLRGRLRDRALRPLVRRTLNLVVRGRLNAVRAGVLARPLGDASELFALAPLVLCLTAEPFEYARSDWPPSVHMVGPCAWDPPADPPAWMAEIERPLILISTSSELQNDQRLVVTALEAFAEEDVEIVATLPAQALPDIDVPANAHVERFLPHSPLLAVAACAVTHGGAGITQKALAAGVPVCVVPFGRDQGDVARRVEIVDAGTRLPATRLSPQRLRAAVRQAMTMGPGARRVAGAFAAAGGPAAAVDAFEALVSRWRSGDRSARRRPMASNPECTVDRAGVD